MHQDAGRATAASLAAGMAYIERWLDAEAASTNLWLVGFSGGALMAGALLLRSPQRFAGVAMLHGTLPFETGIPLEPGRLAGCEVFYGYGERDAIIPRTLVDRSQAYLREQSGAHAEVRGYRAGHEISAAEERDLARWFAALS